MEYIKHYPHQALPTSRTRIDNEVKDCIDSKQSTISEVDKTKTNRTQIHDLDSTAEVFGNFYDVEIDPLDSESFVSKDEDYELDEISNMSDDSEGDLVNFLEDVDL